MSASFSLAAILYALGVGVAFAVAAVRGHQQHPLLLPALGMVEILVVIQAVIDLVQLAGGHHRPAEPATHVGYLVASIAIVPISAAAARMDQQRWSCAALAIGCLVVAIVSIRLNQTLGQPSHA